MSDQPNAPDPVNTMAWNEVVTPNKDATVKFYSELFGWTTEDWPLPDGTSYTIFKLGDRPVAGCIQPPAEAGAPPCWMTYAHVVDLDDKIAAAKAAGATILRERTDLPMGSFAIVLDPVGAAFAFWQPAENADCPG